MYEFLGDPVPQHLPPNPGLDPAALAAALAQGQGGISAAEQANASATVNAMNDADYASLCAPCLTSNRQVKVERMGKLAAAGVGLVLGIVLGKVAFR